MVFISHFYAHINHRHAQCRTHISLQYKSSNLLRPLKSLYANQDTWELSPHDLTPRYSFIKITRFKGHRRTDLTHQMRVRTSLHLLRVFAHHDKRSSRV